MASLKTVWLLSDTELTYEEWLEERVAVAEETVANERHRNAITENSLHERINQLVTDYGLAFADAEDKGHTISELESKLSRYE